MTDNLRPWDKLGKILGGNRNPFETPLGPTEECLSSNQIVSFVGNGENDSKILQHLESCKSCHENVTRFKAVR